jgi:hypothetical protein
LEILLTGGQALRLSGREGERKRENRRGNRPVDSESVQIGPRRPMTGRVSRAMPEIPPIFRA